MKKLLILIAFSAVFLHYFPQPELESWYEENKSNVMDTISEATDTQVSLSVSKVIKELKSVTTHFDDDELDYVKEVTTDKKSVETFYEEHCKEESHNDQLAADHVGKVCGVLDKFSLFL